ncbi:MAG: 5-oxoprolinase subunit PxpB, partial [Vicinamibacterales bacterium]
DAPWLEAEMQSVAAVAEEDVGREGALVEVPVCYDGDDLAPDLATVAAFGGCSPEAAVTIHAAGTYRVYMIGFVPGFAYLGEVDPRIAAPRRSTPRAAVPAGAVAIAGRQTGIYPSVTPGGWNIVGRTSLKPYDAERSEPFLFRTGDTVRFVRISRDELDRRA